MNRDGIRAGVAVAALLLSIAAPIASVPLAAAQAAKPAGGPPASPLGGEGYTPVLPARLLDTRPGFATVDALEAGGGIVAAGETIDVTVLDRGGVPSSGVDSVVLHVTAVKQTVMGFVTVFPSGETRPTVSSLNPVPGAVSSNLVAVHVGANGKVSLYNSAGTTHLIVDVEGWFPAGPTFHGVTPARLIDTRESGTKVGPAGVLDVQVTGSAGIPAGVTSVALNVTVVGATTSTFVTVYPTGTALPATSNLNAQPGIIASNLVIGELSPAGKVRLYNATGSVHLIVDVMGYFENGPGYTPIYPARVIDTRGGTPLAANTTTEFHLTGIGGVPASGVGAVAFNLTAVHQTERTYLTVFPHGAVQPLSSDLNPRPGVVAPNLVFGKVGPDGSVSLYNNAGTVDVIIDVVGWFPSNTVAGDDTATVTEDDPATAIDVLANDTDYDGGPLLIDFISPPTNGTVVVVADTSLTYEPDANYCNTVSGTSDTFTYTLNGGTAATVSVDVTCVDDLPVAVNDNATIEEDAGATAIDVLGNDTDVDGGAETIESVTQPGDGTVVITGGGTGVTYEPSADYCNSVSGPDTSFTYTLNGGSSATVTVTVTCVDDAPSAVDDTAAATEDGGAVVIAVLSNDTDVDGGPKTVDAVTQPANGSAIITGGGTGVSYTPVPNYCNNPPGTVLDTFSYTLNGGSSANVTVTVDCVDDAPVAVIDHLILSEDAGETPTDVLANDVDVDGGPKLVISVTQPANGTAAVVGGGTGVSYTPDANYCNSVSGPDDTFSYTLNGGSVAAVTVTVNCVDDAPVAVADDATVGEDSGANALTVLANDTDIDGGPLSIASVTQPANGAVVITGGGTGLTYAPNANYCNNPPGTTLDVFTYTLNGGSIANVTVTVDCVDDAPSAVNDSKTLSEDASATAVDVLANDTDVDGGLKSVSAVTQPAHGTVVITGGGTGFTYEPVADYCNDGVGGDPDTFTYTLNGGSSATVSVTVSCVDDAPVAVPDSASMFEDAGATAIDVLFNDLDVDGGPQTVASVTQPNDGTVVITGGGSGLTYEPDADYCNDPPGITLDTFAYTLNGGLSASVSVTVTCVDDAATAVLDTPTVTQNDPATAVDVLDNDFDVDGGAAFVVTSVTQPSHGTVAITGGGTGLTYQPNLNYCNDLTPPTDNFTYTLTGGSIGNVHVTVICVDIPPVAVADSATVVEDSGANAIDVLANDTDLDGGPKSIASVTQPANGAVVITGGGTGLTYAPTANYCNNPPGTTLDSFTYALTPGGSSTTVTVTVDCVDDPPVAVSNSASMSEDAGQTFLSVLNNDTDIDGGPKFIVSATQGTHGSVFVEVGGGILAYTPDANYCNNPPGSSLDTFTYTLNGGSTATVAVTVDCVDDNPTAVADGATVVEDSGANAISVLTNDTDVDGGPKSIASVTQPANGAVVITGGGTGLTYAPNANYCNNPPGTTLDTFTYTLTPGGSFATVTMTVTCVDDSPTAIADSTTVQEDATAAAVGVLTNDTDIDGGPKSIASATQPANGTVAITGGGTGLTYAPNANYCNDQAPATTDDFTYTLAPGGSSTTVHMSVTCVNDAPAVATPTYSAVANMTINVPAGSGALAGASDVEGTTLSVANVSAPSVAGSVVSVNATTGAVDFTPKPGYTGAVTFTYDVCDSGIPLPAVCTNVTATVNVAGPVIWFVDDSAASGGDGTLSKPFQTLTAAAAAAVANDHIFVLSGSYATGVTLKSGGWLIGQPTTGSTFDSLFGLSPSANVQVRPTMATGSVAISGEVALGTSSKVRGIAINSATKGLSGSSADTVDVDQTSIANSSSTGPALDLSSVSGTLVLANVSQAGGTTGISITGSTATVTVQAGAITSTTSNGITITGGSGTISIASTVNVSTGRAVEVANRTSGTVALSAAVTATGGTGVSLTSNTGAAVNLTGVVTLSTGANDAFTATGGGTINVSSSASTLVTTTGTALNVANTTIAAGGIRFKSITAGTGASGPVNGIVLNNTGGLGSLTVSGSGGLGSGGTIQHTSGAGISLLSTFDPWFTKMIINNTGGSGVSGSGVVGFTFINGAIDTSGSTGTADTSNIAFNTSVAGTENNLSGAVTITGNTLTNAAWHGIDILNFNGTVSSANISNNTITSSTNAAASLGSGIRLQAFGSTSTVANVTAATINTNTIANFPSGGGVVAQGGNTNAAGSPGIFGTPGSANKITMTGNTISGQNSSARMGTSAISATVNGKGVANFAIDNNQLSNTTGQSLLLGANGNTTAEYLVTNNTIVANNTVASPGIGLGTGVTFGTSDTATITATITGNNISQTDGNGILAVARGATGTLKVKIQNNTVAAPLTGVRPGIRVDAGSGSSVNDTVCLNIGGNTSAGSGGSQGIGLRKQGTVSSTNVFGVNGMAATASPGVETYVSGLNPAGNGTLLVSATSGFTSCSLP